MASTSVNADFGLLEGMAKQVAKDAVTATAPETVKNVEAAGQAVQQAQDLKSAVSNAPDALKQQVADQAKAAAQQKIVDSANAVAPGAVQNIEAAKQTLDQANTLKNAVTNTPDALKANAQEAVKAKAQQEATKGLVDLMR